MMIKHFKFIKMLVLGFFFAIQCIWMFNVDLLLNKSITFIDCSFQTFFLNVRFNKFIIVTVDFEL